MNYDKEFEKDCRIRGLTKQTILTYRSNISGFLAATQNLEMYLAWRECNSHTKWLWVTERGGRIHKYYVGSVIGTLAQPIGLHNPSGALCERLTLQCTNDKRRIRNRGRSPYFFL
jgi:hypothetical protein